MTHELTRITRSAISAMSALWVIIDGMYLVTRGVPHAEVGRILEFLTVGGRRVSFN
jgi:hypothetical protein